MENCIFCKIVAGDIPAYKVYEDDNILAFLDISQATKGHTLVIPKGHVQDIYSLSPLVAGNLFGAIPRLANAIKEAFNCKGINIVSNNEVAAGQTVFHFHVHLIPRYDENDSFKMVHGSTETSKEDFIARALEIKKYL